MAERGDLGPNGLLLEHLERSRARLGLEPGAFRILDWGCGKGRHVLWLRERGYDAVGVEVNPGRLPQADRLFAETGHERAACIFLLDHGAAPFPDASFHFVLSWQVLEHVIDLRAVASELRRVTASLGEGIHVFPVRRRVVEPHLFMPFLHWLPKNRLRKVAIRAFLAAGVDPNWWPEGLELRKQVETYYRFSVDETFYRSARRIEAQFAEAGFQTELLDANGRGRAWRALAAKLPLTLVWRTFGPDVALLTRRR